VIEPVVAAGEADVVACEYGPADLNRLLILGLDPAEVDRPQLKELGYEVVASIESLRGHVWRLNKEAAGR
jgi:hypothetical protein